MSMGERITDDDLNRYVDGQLSLSRRIHVEAHLSDHPEAAARVMADLRARDELKLMLKCSWTCDRDETRDAATRLRTVLRRDHTLRPVRRAVAVACLILVGFLAHEALGPLAIREVSATGLPPKYLEDALHAHETGIVRAAMLSQPEVREYDREEIERATSIQMPDLPDDWRVLDAQVFPSRFGPSVEIALEVDDLGLVSLYSVRPGDAQNVPVTTAQQNGYTVAYWQIGKTAYALSGRVNDRTLDRLATRLSRSHD